jgi:hypothetical protein
MVESGDANQSLHLVTKLKKDWRYTSIGRARFIGGCSVNPLPLTADIYV